MMIALGLSSASFAAGGASWPAGGARLGQATALAAPTGEGKPASAQMGKQELTPAQQRTVARLQQIDKDVRAHEQAHMAAGGSLVTGGPTYTYTYGPDGKEYATGGEVGIDTSAEKKPEDNIRKGEQIQAAALAPADPSGQDYRVAAAGQRLAANGRMDLAAEQRQAQAAAADQARQRVQEAYGGGANPGAAVSTYA